MTENYQEIYEQILMELEYDISGNLNNGLQGLVSFIELCNNDKFKRELPSLLQEMAPRAQESLDRVKKTSERMGKEFGRVPEERKEAFKQYHQKRVQENF